MRELLVVDDERDLLETLGYNLRGSGFSTQCAASAEEALNLLDRAVPSAAILDIGLPGMSGLDLCRELRSRNTTANLPILMLSARDDVIDRVVALEIGADDYVVKPFSVRELLLRIEGLLRRSAESPASTPTTHEQLALGPLLLNLATRQCHVDGQELLLTQIEFDLLATLMSRPGRVQSRERLLADVWHLDPSTHSRTVDTHIKRLRSKLGANADVIRTLRGVGYSAQAG